VSLRVELIVAVQTQAIEAAQRATSSIPIVFCATGDPVGSGFAKSLSRPGGNVTGVSTITNELGPKQLEMVKSAFPQASSVGVLMNPTNKASAELRRSIESAGQKSGVRVLPLDARNQGELEKALATAAKERTSALIVLADGYFFQARKFLAEAAVKHRLPTLGWSRELADAGALMTYGPALRENYYRAALYVDRILKGAKPSDLAIEQPTKVEFVVNLKTAKQLGIVIPEPVLWRADTVIQ